VNVVEAVAPIATVAIIVALILARRVNTAGMGAAMRRMTERKPKPPRGVVVPFERSRMDEELNALLRNRR
jgi:hypothetical protein